jgi:hypothetical protein
MLNVTYKPFVLSIALLNIALMSIVMLSIVMLSMRVSYKQHSALQN